MKKKSILGFIILFSVVFAIFVSIRYFDRNKLVQLGSEFSLEKDQLVKVANKDYTNIKLISIEDICNNEICSSSKRPEYKLLINGKEYTITDIPTTINIYEDGDLEVLDGDEDRIVLKFVEK